MIQDLYQMHALTLRKRCKQLGIDITGTTGKAAYIKLLMEHDKMHKQPLNTTLEETPTPTLARLVATATAEDLKSVGISSGDIRLDKLKADLNALTVVMRHPRKSHKLAGGGVEEKKFGTDVYYEIDKNEETIHFKGNCLGPVCTTLNQPDKVIMRVAAHYLGTFTWDARLSPNVAGKGFD